MRKTRLGERLDQVVCSHDLGLPKEDPAFWDRLQQVVPFDPARTLFVDDSLAVLASARQYGIARLLAILCPDTRQAERRVESYPAARGFAELLPGLRSALVLAE